MKLMLVLMMATVILAAGCISGDKTYEPIGQDAVDIVNPEVVDSTLDSINELYGLDTDLYSFETGKVTGDIDEILGLFG